MATTKSNEYHYAVWRRKETSAVVKLFPKWTWKFTVKSSNKIERTLQEYFGWNNYLYDKAMECFKVLWVDYITKFDAEIRIIGGGISWQADAIKLAFARALIERNSELRNTLKPFGLLKRDPRIKERKKPWLKKARKRPKRSKR